MLFPGEEGKISVSIPTNNVKLNDGSKNFYLLVTIPEIGMTKKRIKIIQK